MSTTSQPIGDKSTAQLPALESSCARCGAPLEALDHFCQNCGLPQAVAEDAQPVRVQKHFKCETCGAEISIDPDQRSYTCAFCDSTYVVELATTTGRQPPEFVIGFRITPEQAQQKFRRWLEQGGWFYPVDLQRTQIADKLRGIYLPFWSFSMRADSRWSASIGEYWWRTETYRTRVNGKWVTKTRRVRETEWWHLAGRHHAYYSGHLVSASRGLTQHAAERIKPFHLPALKRYAPAYLAGWASEEYSLESEQALELCQAEFYRQEQQAVRNFLPGDTARDLTVDTRFSQIHSDLILLPVYLLSYRYGDKVYRFLLNGQTGAMSGDRPLSWPRVWLAAGIGLLVIALLLLFILQR